MKEQLHKYEVLQQKMEEQQHQMKEFMKIHRARRGDDDERREDERKRVEGIRRMIHEEMDPQINGQ